MTMPVIDILPGGAPLIINIPHDGREIPSEISATMTAEALALPDTDWHIRDLYGFARGLGATITSARYSRYVVDLNRDPAGKSLYPDADTTEICPTSTFRNKPIYQNGQNPNVTEITRRVELFWKIYHSKLQTVISEKRQKFESIILFDAHSIASELPRFFEGHLPDFNLGTADGESADTELTAQMFNVLTKASGYSAILNGRFKGGYITRNYGDPGNGIHAIQLEMGQNAYMENGPPYRLIPERAENVVPVLRDVLNCGLNWINNRYKNE